MGLRGKIVHPLIHRLRRKNPDILKYETGRFSEMEESAVAFVVDMEIAAHAIPSTWGEEVEYEDGSKETGRMDSGRKLYAWFRNTYLKRIIPGNRRCEQDMAPGEYSKNMRYAVLIADNRPMTPDYKTGTQEERRAKAAKELVRLQTLIPRCPSTKEELDALPINDDYMPHPSLINCSSVQIGRVIEYLMQCVAKEYHSTPGLAVYFTCPTIRGRPKAPTDDEPETHTLHVRDLAGVPANEAIIFHTADGFHRVTTVSATAWQSAYSTLVAIDGRSTIGLPYAQVYEMLAAARHSVEFGKPEKQDVDMWITFPENIVDGKPAIHRGFRTGENIRISECGPEAPPPWTGSGEGEILSAWWSKVVLGDMWGVRGNRIIFSTDQDNYGVFGLQPARFCEESFVRLTSLEITREEYDALLQVTPWRQSASAASPYDEWGFPSGGAGTYGKRILPPEDDKLVEIRKAKRAKKDPYACDEWGFPSGGAGTYSKRVLPPDDERLLQDSKAKKDHRAAPPKKITVRVYVDMYAFWKALHGEHAHDITPQGVAILSSVIYVHSDFNIDGLSGVAEGSFMKVWDKEAFARAAAKFDLDGLTEDEFIDGPLKDLARLAIAERRKTGMLADEWNPPAPAAAKDGDKRLGHRAVAADVYWTLKYWRRAISHPGHGLRTVRCKGEEEEEVGQSDKLGKASLGFTNTQGKTVPLSYK